MSALVAIKDGEVRASSQDVAATFEKAHKDVLRAIDKMIELAPDVGRRNFAPSSFQSSQGRRFRSYDMDRDGFSLLAMGFTGAKALEWKLKYIEAFRRMEEALRQSLNANDNVVIALDTPDELEKLKARLQIVREARIAFGRAAARRAWEMAGLPDLMAGPEALPTPNRARDEANRSIVDWMNDNCEHVPGHREYVGALFDNYLAWCARTGTPAQNLTAFGRYLADCGFRKIKSDRMMRVGLRMR